MSESTEPHGFIAEADVDIAAPADRVWKLLTQRGPDPDIMFGAEIVSDWTPGSAIRWKGEYEGREYEDKGTVIEIDPPRRLVVTHFSPLSGSDDLPENYHRLAYELSGSDGSTHVSLAQDGNESAEAAQHSADNWRAMLDGLKKAAER
ncbi:MAG: SRPBCC domain-containing protein [Microbacterium sp.]